MENASDENYTRSNVFEFFMHNAHKYIIMRVSSAPFGGMHEKLIKNLL